MNLKIVSRATLILMVVLFVTSFSKAAPSAKFTPVGTWEYGVPGVPEGYDRGVMVITENEQGYVVSIGPSEDYLAQAQDVEYSKEQLSFKLIVEYEEVKISGTFDGDKFTGTVSYVEGQFDITAERKTDTQAVL
jgi:hypothetical protein